MTKDIIVCMPGETVMRVTGLGQLGRELEEASRVMSDTQEELGSVKFDPHDPASIEVAIQQAEAMIDERLGEYASNPILGPLAEQMKETFRQGLVDAATEARLEGNKDQ